MFCNTLLLIDDDAEDRAIFKEALEVVDPSLSLRTAPSCEDAIYFLNYDSSIVPDLIFLDLNLPGMTGKQCLVELRKIQNLQYTPIIIYSTSQHSKDIEDTFRLGASFYLTKPGNFKTLCTTLELLLKKYPVFVRRLKNEMVP